jgi:hypothetical protein
VRIFVFGNINAGKTTVIKHLSILLPQYPVFSIDAFRQEYGKGDIQSDCVAQQRFVDAVGKHEQAIVECTGLGPLGHSLHEAMPKHTGIMLHVVSPVETCLERVASKDFAAIPYPPYSETIEQTIIRCDQEILSGELDKLWADRILQSFPVEGSQDSLSVELATLPLRHYVIAETITKWAQKTETISALISLGSFARGTLAQFSDLDFFAVTDCKPQEVIELLSNQLPGLAFVDMLKNKITLRFADNLLCEITIINDIEEMKVFYRESRNTDPERSVIKGDRNVLAALTGFLAADRTEEHRELISFLLSEAFYFLQSLSPLIGKGDRYKYYFHNFIILHNIVRLKAIDAGNSESNYLPLMAIKYLNSDESDTLFFSVADDMNKHFSGLMSYFGDFLQSLGVGDPKKKLLYLHHLERFQSQ